MGGIFLRFFHRYYAHISLFSIIMGIIVIFLSIVLGCLKWLLEWETNAFDLMIIEYFGWLADEPVPKNPNPYGLLAQVGTMIFGLGFGMLIFYDIVVPPLIKKYEPMLLIAFI